MKKYTLVIVLGIILIFLFSCSKKDAPVPETTTQATNKPIATPSVLEYLPLNAGNYWVYKQTEYDTSGSIVPRIYKNDSVVVKNDTVINGKTYHTIVNYNFLSEPPLTMYWRDSADCIVNNDGKIIFSINTSGIIYKNILSPDTLAFVNYSYTSTPTNITVPLGTYSCVDYKGEVYRKADNYNKSILIHNYYCKGIGSVKEESVFIGSLYWIKWDLLSYHIQ